MNTIQSGRVYRQPEAGIEFRIFDVYPDENLAIVARTDGTSAKPKPAVLSDLNAALSYRKLIPVEFCKELSILPEKVTSPSALAHFERLKPALTKILQQGMRELAYGSVRAKIKPIATEYGIAPGTLHAALTRVIAAGGMLEAALPKWHKCGRRPHSGPKGYVVRATNQPNSFNLNSIDFKNIEKGVIRFLVGSATWADAYDDFLDTFYAASVKKYGANEEVELVCREKRPSFFQFKYHAQRLVPLKAILAGRVGERRVNTESRGCPTGQSAPALYPGTTGEIDSTITDIVGVQREGRLSIGRFTLYGVVDAMSGAVMGLHLTMQAPSSWEARRAILTCLEDKVELCRAAGLTIEREDWDIQALPKELRCDRGDANSWKSTSLVSGTGIRLEICPARRPDLKGSIESFFTIFRYKLRALRGGTSGVRERLAQHPNVTAIYDFDQVRRMVYALAICFNDRVRRRQALTPGMVRDGIRPIAREVFRWGVKNGCVREYSLERAKMELLESKFVSVSEQGILIDGLKFVVPDFDSKSPNGIEANDWLMRARIRRFEVEVGIDRSTLDYVFLRHRPVDGPIAVLQCPLSSEHLGFRGFSWPEYEIYKAEEKKDLIDHLGGRSRKTRAFVRRVIRETTAEAKALTSPAREGLSATAQIVGAKERRKAEMVPPVTRPSTHNDVDPATDYSSWRKSDGAAKI